MTEEDLAKQKLRQMQERQTQQTKKQQMAVMPHRPQKLIKIRPLEKPSIVTDISEENEPTVTFFDNMVKESQRKETFIRGDTEDGEMLHDLIRVEEIFIATMIAKCLKLCPSAFENEITKDEIMNLINRASKFLWTNVGATLEHSLLWWSSYLPLACRPVTCTKFLREYLMLIQPDDAPDPINSTLKSLGEVLTVHVGELARRDKGWEIFIFYFLYLQLEHAGIKISAYASCSHHKKLIMLLKKTRNFTFLKSRWVMCPSLVHSHLKIAHWICSCIAIGRNKIHWALSREDFSNYSNQNFLKSINFMKNCLPKSKISSSGNIFSPIHPFTVTRTKK